MARFDENGELKPEPKPEPDRPLAEVTERPSMPADFLEEPADVMEPVPTAVEFEDVLIDVSEVGIPLTTEEISDVPPESGRSLYTADMVVPGLGRLGDFGIVHDVDPKSRLCVISPAKGKFLVPESKDPTKPLVFEGDGVTNTGSLRRGYDPGLRQKRTKAGGGMMKPSGQRSFPSSSRPAGN